MTIPVMQFPQVQVPNEPNPLLTGLQTGLQVYSGLMNAFSMPDQMKQKQAEDQAKLGLTQAQTDLVNAQIAKLQSPTDQYQSSIGKTFSDLEKIKGAYGSDSDEYKSVKSQVDAQMQKQQTMNDFYSMLTSSGPIRYGATPLIKEQIVGRGEQAGQTPEQALYTATRGGMNIGGGGMSQPIMTAQSPEDMAAAQTAANQTQSEIARNIIPVDVQKRQYASARATATLENMKQFIDKGALNYNGLKGQSKLAQDTLTASLTGKVPDQLQAYRNFIAQLSSLKDDVAVGLGTPAQEFSRMGLEPMFHVTGFSNSSDAAKAQLDNIGKLLYKTEGVNLGTIQDIVNKHNQLSMPPEEKGNLKVNPESLQNASPAAAKQLGIQKVEIPTFNSKQQFQDWYKNQSPAIQAMVRRQLGEQ